jgi:hypothetical protein
MYHIQGLPAAAIRDPREIAMPVEVVPELLADQGDARDLAAT